MTAYVNPSLAQGTNDLRYRVRAYNTSGNSEYSNIVAATTPRR